MAPRKLTRSSFHMSLSSFSIFPFRFHFEGLRTVKIKNSIQFPVDSLNLDFVCSAETSAKENCVYDLIGCVCHSGSKSFSSSFSRFSNLNYASCLLENSIFPQRPDVYSELFFYVHQGLTSGHYTSYCKNSLDSNWYSFNDEIISQVTEYFG